MNYFSVIVNSLRRLSVFSALAFVCTRCCALPPTTSAWPQYGIDPRGMRQSAFAGPTTLPHVLWKFSTGDIVYASPIIGSDEKIYFPSYDGKFYAVTSGGSLAWSHTLGGQLRGSAAISSSGNILLLGANGYYSFDLNGAPIFSNASIANSDPSVTVSLDGSVYVSNANTTTLFAFDASGTQKWSLPLSATMEGTPVIGPNGDIYFGTNDGFLKAVSDAGDALPES